MGHEPTFVFMGLAGGLDVDGRAQRLDEMLRPAVEGLGFELVGVEFHAGKRRSLLRLYIDAESGVTLDDCERVSHQVSGLLDVEDPVAGEYDLEVSSPGEDRPLFTAEHFERFRGQRARVTLEVPVEGRRRFTGRLDGVRDGAVVLEVDGHEELIALASIGSARLMPEQRPVPRGRRS